MKYEKLHADELLIKDTVVVELLTSQMPELASLPMRTMDFRGTDNVIIRLGEELAVRLPRTERAAALLWKEQQYLPLLAPHVSMRLPVPIRFGSPSSRYPWNWSVCRWIAGRNPKPGECDLQLARDLAQFIRTLHTLDTYGLKSEGALRSYRADSIQLRDSITRHSITACDGLVDREQLFLVWDQVKRVDEFNGKVVWTHSDLHPGNILVRRGRLHGVIDWGSLILGDPAIDCIVAWNLLKPDARVIFREEMQIGEETWNRGRAWAFSIAIVALPYYIRTNRQIAAWAIFTVQQVIQDVLECQ